MARRIRMITGGAAALAFLSAQASAAPALRIDPLVSLSAFGTVQSQSAVCAAGASAAASGAATTATAQRPAGCVLPITAAPVAPVAQTPPPPLVQTAAAPAKGVGTLPLLLGLGAIAALAAFLLLDKDDDDGDLVPVSPD